MLTFNALLEEAGLDPKKVKMARHRDNRFKVTPYSVWRTDADAFRIYNSIQLPKKFNKADYIASFVVTPAGETLFTGIYENSGIGDAPQGTVCPVSGEIFKDNKGVFYDLKLTDYLSDYSGRVSIDWGGGAIAWVQWANRQPKSIVEIRKQFEEPVFPGFENFSVHLDEVNKLPENWKSVLRSVHGVYLLAHLTTGQLYVGSAYGKCGFLQRWEEYAANGHGGNVELIKLKSRNFRLSVLKVCASDADVNDVTGSESNWKHRLCSRSLGLNAN